MDENTNTNTTGEMTEREHDEMMADILPGGVIVLIHWLAVLLSSILQYFDANFVPLAGF